MKFSNVSFIAAACLVSSAVSQECNGNASSCVNQATLAVCNNGSWVQEPCADTDYCMTMAGNMVHCMKKPAGFTYDASDSMDMTMTHSSAGSASMDMTMTHSSSGSASMDMTMTHSSSGSASMDMTMTQSSAGSSSTSRSASASPSAASSSSSSKSSSSEGSFTAKTSILLGSFISVAAIALALI
ncbi:hypothetical protein AYI70_g1238 [Smittium culicis]|uniref:Extracellular membrane protein CFEM domain-containing protein n=1 Tax=Smittium culicis TaxID=133412 RepID=A0A1R1YDE8_9FUNG|nr:hypothetical protein AYI70_g1238 [Smittium culicis]